MKKWANSLVATGLVLGGLSSAVMPMAVHAATTATANPFTVIVEDKQISFDVPPQIIHDRAFVPVRSLAEALGAAVDYNGSTRVATITKDDIVLVLDFKTGKVTKNGTVVPMDAPPQIVDNRALVPLRFISLAFGNDVTYDAATHTASVLASPKTLERRAQIQDVLTAEADAGKSIDSYELNLSLHMDQAADEDLPEIKMDCTLVIDSNKSPLALYEKESISTNLYGTSGPYNVEEYLVDGKEYGYDPILEQWTYSTVSQNQMSDLANLLMTPNQDKAEVAIVLPYMTMTEDDHTYTLVTMMDKFGMLKYEGYLKQHPAGSGSLTLSDLDGYDSLTMTQKIDKTTYQQTGFQITLSAQGTKGLSTLEMDGTISKINSVPTVTVPQDVVDRAVPADTSSDGTKLMTGL